MADTARIDVEFQLSAPTLGDCPAAGAPEIALAGRSNSGKSSVLNRLTGSRQTARVSKTPGRTQALNFFNVNGGGRLVDLPGYGYAKAGRSAQTSWQSSVNQYLSAREPLVAVVLVMDIRHPLQPQDLELTQWAQASQMPLLVLLNKADKLKHGARQNILRKVAAELEQAPSSQVMLFSARSGLGTEAVVALLRQWLSKPDDQ